MDYLFLKELSHSLGWIEYFAWHVLGFSVLYFSQASLALFCTEKLFPRLNWGKKIDTRPIKPGQIKKEIINSFVSIQFLSFAAVLALKLEQMGVLTIHWQAPSYLQLLGQILLFFVWNEAYFYISHRLLHTPWLYRNSHIEHHRSVVTTPFSTFSFHWIEALFYSGIMISVMAWFDFHILAIMIWPGLSLTANALGHYNYALSPRGSFISLFTSSWRHALHHSHIKGNYSFWLPQVDQLFKTQVNHKATPSKESKP